MNKNKKSILLIIVLIITIALGYFTFNPASLLNLLGNPKGALYGELSAIVQKIPTEAGRNLFLSQSENLTKKVDLELVDLDSQIISCNPEVTGLFSSSPTIGGSCLAGPTTLSTTKGLYLGGQCCGVMKDTNEYHERLEKLQAYKKMPDIILDPMHTPIGLAKKWIDYDKSTTLTPEEQKIYDQAYTLSDEKPCCCKCWHYFVDEGIAKKMIKLGTFNSKEIADFWDASEICGT